MADSRTTEHVDGDRDPAATRLLGLARQLLADPAIADAPWVGVTLTATIGWWDPALVRKVNAWRFLDTPVPNGNRWAGVRFSDRDDLDAALIDLALAMAERDEGQRWNHCLLQIDRATMDLNARFDHGETSPWSVDVSRLDESVEELRPAPHSD